MALIISWYSFSCLEVRFGVADETLGFDVVRGDADETLGFGEVTGATDGVFPMFNLTILFHQKCDWSDDDAFYTVFGL